MKNSRHFNNLILILIMTAVFTFGGLVSAMATDEEGQGNADAQNVQEIQAELEAEADVDVDADVDVEKSDVDEDVNVDVDVDEEDIEISEDEETLEEEVDVVDDEEDVVEEIIDEEEEVEVIEVIDEEDVEDEDIEDVDAEDVDENNDEEEITIVIPPAEVEEINEIGDAVYEAPNEDEVIVEVIPPVEVEPIEEIGSAVYEPPMTSIVTVKYDDEEGYELYADEEGAVEIRDLFHSFDEGASGSETLELTVNGVSYMITVGSDGSILGELPEGFSIKDGVLRIEGAYEDIDLVLTRLYAMSAIYEEPVFEAPITLAPAGTIRTTRYNAITNTENSSSNSNYYGYADNYTDEIAAESEEVAEEKDESIEITEEFVFPDDIEDEEVEVLGAYSDDTDGNFPTAVLLIGVAGAIAALGGIWKVGLFRA